MLLGTLRGEFQAQVEQFLVSRSGVIRASILRHFFIVLGWVADEYFEKINSGAPFMRRDVCYTWVSFILCTPNYFASYSRFTEK